jgi:hypothetical protein
MIERSCSAFQDCTRAPVSCRSFLTRLSFNTTPSTGTSHAKLSHSCWRCKVRVNPQCTRLHISLLRVQAVVRRIEFFQHDVTEMRGKCGDGCTSTNRSPNSNTQTMSSPISHGRSSKALIKLAKLTLPFPLPGLFAQTQVVEHTKWPSDRCSNRALRRLARMPQRGIQKRKGR